MKYEDYAGSKLEAELYRAINTRLVEVANSLLTGSIKSFEEYKYWMGYAEALKNMNDIIVVTRKKVNN